MGQGWPKRKPTRDGKAGYYNGFRRQFSRGHSEETPMNKVAIVTGASSGIGASICSLFASSAYRVMAAGRNADALDAIAARAEGILAWTGDLAEDAACERLVADCVRRFERLDVLVNNAGIYIRGEAEATSAESWRRTLAVNLDAPFFLSKAALPHLRQTRGAIINVASDWGLQGGRRAAAYCASKGGLVLLTRAMALDHAAEGIRVNAICPGDVDTPMLVAEALHDGLTHEQALETYGRASPTGRVTRAEEVAALALYLASDQAAQITGAAIPIDGGNTA
jgi:meso-butanediol dehydrogenase/(S,S)-butanediol dehydrogenase/diacetyl reductase